MARGSGLDASVQLNWKGQTVTGKTDNQVTDGLHSFGRAVRTGAKARAPVRTGRMRFSIDYRVGGGLVWLKDRIDVVQRGPVTRAGGIPKTSVIIATGMAAPCGYGAYVELGTRFMVGRPFIRPAFDAESSRLSSHIRAR